MGISELAVVSREEKAYRAAAYQANTRDVKDTRHSTKVRHAISTTPTASDFWDPASNPNPRLLHEQSYRFSLVENVAVV
jgi:hypothetical protein